MEYDFICKYFASYLYIWSFNYDIKSINDIDNDKEEALNYRVIITNCNKNGNDKFMKNVYQWSCHLHWPQSGLNCKRHDQQIVYFRIISIL